MSMETAMAEPARAGLGLATRRAALLVLAAGAMSASPAMAADEHAGHGEHAHHDHSTGPKHQKLIDAALTCVGRGEVCLDHCIQLLATGDTALKYCIRTVSAMLPMCAALSRLAALDAQRLKDVAKVCIDVCADCEKECRRHQDQHPACKACAVSCADCIQACKAVIGA
jgi:Cys-rich four helix bundle protein (predicted Tat secretion target)